jgi:hypothetical protein
MPRVHEFASDIARRRDEPDARQDLARSPQGMMGSAPRRRNFRIGPFLVFFGQNIPLAQVRSTLVILNE